MSKGSKKRYIGYFMISAALITLWVSFSTQDKPKNEIRILIDRAPNTLDAGQNPDTLARKIVPLVSEYTVKEPHSLEDFVLTPKSANQPSLHFILCRDELARAILFERGQADVLLDSLSLSKTEWFRKRGARIISTKGFHLSSLGFNLMNTTLGHLKVRQAIALALPVNEWIEHKYFNWVNRIPETPTTVDLIQSQRLLDEAGFPADAHSERFHLRYITTPVREGNELALLTREALSKVGIVVDIIPLETSLFFNRVKRKDFEIFSARIFRSSQGESVSDFLYSQGVRNYFSYSNPGLDSLFQINHSLTWAQVAPYVREDLPLIPLFEWNRGLFLSERIEYHSDGSFESEDSFRFLAKLQLK